MATAVQTMTPEDQAFIDAWQNQTTGKYAKWGTTLPKLFTYADKLKNIKSFYTDASKEYKPLAIKLGVEWLKANNPDILDETGNPFTDGFYADVISGDAATQKANAGTLDAIRTTSATDYVDKTLNAKGTLGTAARAAEIAKITQGTKTDPYTPAKLATAVNSVRDTTAYKPTSMTFDELKSTYGGMNDPTTGKPLFSDTELQAVADAKTEGAIKPFNTKLNSLATQVLDSQNKSVYTVQSPTDRAAALKTLLGNPSKLVSSVNALYDASNPNTDTVASGTGIDLLKNYRGGSTKNYSLAQEQAMIDAYDPNKGTWSLPTVGDKAAVDKSPFGSYVQNMLTSYANKGDYYSPGYESSVDMPETPNLTNINKPFDDNPTSSDLLKLVNSAGTVYDPTNAAKSSLSPVVRQLYQPQKNADGSQVAKPGVPDPTKTVIPTTTEPDIDKSKPLIQVNPDGSAMNTGKVVDPNLAANTALANTIAKAGGIGNNTLPVGTSSGGVSDLFPKELYDALKANRLEAEQTGSQKSVDDWRALQDKYGEDKFIAALKQLRQDADIDVSPKRQILQDESKKASTDYQDIAFNIGQKEKAYYQSLVDNGYTGSNDAHALYLRDHPEEAAKDAVAIDNALKNSVYAQNAAYFDSSSTQKPYSTAWGEPKSDTEQLSSWLAEQQQVIDRLKGYDTRPSTDPFASSYRNSDWSRLNFLNTNIGKVDPSKVITYTPATAGNESTFTLGQPIATAASTITGSAGQDSVSGGSYTDPNMPHMLAAQKQYLDVLNNPEITPDQKAKAQTWLNQVNGNIALVDPTKVVTYTQPATTNPYVAAGGIDGTQVSNDTIKTSLDNTPFNAGIVTPNINNVVSKENLNTDVKGVNGESGVVPLLYADMAKNTGRVPTPMVQGWGGTPIPETSMTNTGTPVLTESLPNSNLDNQSYTITSNQNTPAGITSLVGPRQLTPQQLAQQQLLQSTGIGRS